MSSESLLSPIRQANNGFETHLFVIWDKGRRVAERRILDDIRKRFQVVYEGEMSFPCPAAEGYCRFYGARDPNLVKKASYCGKGPFIIVVVKVAEQKKFVDQDGKLVNALMFSCKKTYRRWSGGFFRVHGTLQPAEFERDVFKLTGCCAAEWENGVPTGLHMELPPLESLPSLATADAKSWKKRNSAKRSKGFWRVRIANAARPLARVRFLRSTLRRPFLNLLFGLPVRRKAASVGRGVNVEGPCSVTRRTAIGVCVSIGSMAVFCGGELAIGDNVRISSDVNVITRDFICDDDDDERKRLGGAYSRSGVTIGNSARIGSNVTILPGTIIGRGAVVLDGAVAQGCIPDSAVYGGTPGRIVAERNGALEEGGSVQELCATIGAGVDAEGLEMLVDRRSGLLHRCVLSGTWHGKPCIVKWTDNDPGSIENEYEVGKVFHEASGGLSPQMYCFRREGQCATCVMERLPGKPLASIVGELACGDARTKELGGQIAGLFATMRRIGMCHRDLHPGNIMVDESGVARLFDFQNASLASLGKEAFAHALAASRAYIYKFRSLHQSVIGLYNDCEHMLAKLDATGALHRELSGIWRGKVRDYDYYCPVGAYHAIRFALRSVGVCLRAALPCQESVLDKLRTKLAVTGPSLRYWVRHGVTGRAGFVSERKGC